MNLLDLMGAPPAPAPVKPAAAPAQPSARAYTSRTIRPMWRNGAPVPGSDKGYVPPRLGDLRWLVHAYQDGTSLGRWYRWSEAKDCQMWICIDPADATGINAHPDTPPTGRAGA